MSASSLAKGKGKEVRISLSINRSRSSSTIIATNTNPDTGMSFDVDYIPEDIWLTVFEQLPPSDLARLSATCRKFHHLTQRPLLREIRWIKASSAQRNIRDWGAGQSLEQFTGIVRKVEIRLSFRRLNQGGDLANSVDWTFYDSAFSRLRSFNNLRTLELVDTILTPALYPVLATITSLRELAIIRCIFVWSPLYPVRLPTLGRPNPAGGVQHYNLGRDPQHYAEQEQWFIDNHNFNFAQELSHITHLTFKYNRLDFHGEHSRASADDIPYPSSEINKPSILHPLYLLTLTSLTDLTITWTATMMQVHDVLRQDYNFGGNVSANAGVPGGPLAITNAGGGTVVVPPQIQFPQMQIFGNNPPTTLSSLMHVMNPFGHNPFVPLRPDFPSLNHLTLIIDDLSRDTMDSVVGLFERRIHSPTAGIAPLRIKLKVGKHTLTEQHIGTIQFRLPGVYRFEGPLPIAGLLNAGSEAMGVANAMEELRMSEAMDMGMILHNLEKLPRTMKKLSIRMFKWDGEILYAVRSLFKGLKELVVQYGKGSLPENNHVMLGSDILPELKELHTLRLFSSPECVKRERSLNNPYNQGGYPNNNGASTWWAMSSVNFHTNVGGGHHHHQMLNPYNHHPLQLDVTDDDDGFDAEAEEWSDDTIMDDDMMALEGSLDYADLDQDSSDAGPSTSSAGPSSSTGSASTSAAGGSGSSGISRGSSGSSSASASTSTGSLSSGSRHFRVRRRNPDRLSSPASSSNGQHAVLDPIRRSRSSRNRSERPTNSTLTSNASTSTSASSTPVVESTRVQTEADRIAASLRDDLGDYLVGWNRHCPSLRVVQIEREITWLRRFNGDVWTPVENKPRPWEGDSN